MSALTGNSVGSSYLGLLKTADNAAINTNLKNIEDGAGNASPLSLATNYVQLQAPTIELIESTGGTNLIQITSTNTYFEGAVDFTNSTVTGLPGGAAGLTNDTSANTLISAAFLTTNPASAQATLAIALGEQTTVTSAASAGICIGSRSTVAGARAISLGRDNGANFADSVAIGFTANSFNNAGVAIGRLARNNNFAGNNGIAIGNGARNDVDGAVALGASVIAAKVNTVSVTELETQLAGGGITMKSPNGTEYKLTVSDAGALVIT